MLWDGLLGKAVSGVHPDLFKDIEVTVRHSSTHFACSMKAESKKVEALYNHCSELKSARGAGTTAACNTEIIKCLQWDSIGAACDPLCGGCHCGKCAPGGKEMSLTDEPLNRRGLTSKLCDSHSVKPHRDASYPWKEDPAILLPCLTTA